MSLVAEQKRTMENPKMIQARLDDLLYRRFPEEIGCAFVASGLVSPLVSIIDKAIVTEITGIGALFSSMGIACKEMVVTPGKFFSGLSFRLTFGVYFGTYAVANIAEAVLDHQQHYTPRDDATRKGVKVAFASVANVGLLAWRDSVFAKVFGGAEAAKKTTPMRTIGLFAARDSATMAATFYAAPLYSDYLQQEHQWTKNRANVFAALTIPVITQFLTAPLHIHALDVFNRVEATTASRFDKIKSEMGKVCFARGFRVLPAFGLGSYSNLVLRETINVHHYPENTFKDIRRRVTAAGGATGGIMARPTRHY